MTAEKSQEKRNIINNLIQKLKVDFGIRITFSEPIVHRRGLVSLYGVNGIKFLMNADYDNAIDVLQKMYEKNKNMTVRIRKISKSDYEKGLTVFDFKQAELI